MKFVVPAENNSLKPSTHKSTDNMILIRDQVREEPLQVADGRAAGAEDDSQPKIKELKDIQELMTTVNHVKKLSSQRTKLAFLQEQVSIDESSFKVHSDQEFNSLINELRKKWYHSDEEEH